MPTISVKALNESLNEPKRIGKCNQATIGRVKKWMYENSVRSFCCFIFIAVHIANCTLRKIVLFLFIHFVSYSFFPCCNDVYVDSMTFF